MKKLYALAAGLIACTSLPSVAVTPDQEVTVTYWRNADANGDGVYDETENYQIFEPTKHLVYPAKAKEGNWTITNFQNSGYNLDFQILNTDSNDPTNVNIRYWEGTSYKLTTFRPKNSMNAYVQPQLRSLEQYQIPAGYDNWIYGLFIGTYVNIYPQQSYANYGAYSHADVIREDDDEIEYRVRMGSGWTGRLYDDNEDSEYYNRNLYFSKHQYGYVEFTFVAQKDIVKYPVVVVDADKQVVASFDARHEENEGVFTMTKLLNSKGRVEFTLGDLVDGRGAVNFEGLEGEGFQTLYVDGEAAIANVTGNDGNVISGELKVNPAGSYFVSENTDFWLDYCTVYLNVMVGDKELYVTYKWNVTSQPDDSFQTYTARFGTTGGLQMGTMEVKAKFDFPNSVEIANFLNGGVNVRFRLDEIQENILISGTGDTIYKEDGTFDHEIPNENSLFFDRYPVKFFDGQSEDYPNLNTYQTPKNPDGTVFKNGIFTYPLLEGGEMTQNFKSAYVYINDGQSRYRIDRNIESDPTKDLHNFRVFVWAEKIGGGSGNYYFSIDRLVDAQSSGVEVEAADENAPVEYYNLQGIRVSNPENGIFIRRQGKKVSKIRF